MADETVTNDWFWDIDRQVAVRADNSGKHDVLIGPYPTRNDAEIWLPSANWVEQAKTPRDDDWTDVNSAYD